MNVGKRMARNLITAQSDDTIEAAFELMKKHSIHHLPVLEGDELVGIVTDRDIRLALIPWKSTKSEKVFYYFTEELKIKEIMTPDPITISPESDMEEAARLMRHYKIGGLPVVERGELVGIVTQNDILEVFIEIMGVIGASVRVDVILGDRPDAFGEVSNVIKAEGGEIISVGMSAHENSQERIYYFRLKPLDLKPLVKALGKKGYKVVSAME